MSQEAYELLGDSLSGSTRSDRRGVLVYSSVCLLIAYTGIVPTEPSLLGFKFPGLTDDLMYWILFFLAAFSYVCFVTRFLTDYKRYRYLRDRLDLAGAQEMQDAIYTEPEAAMLKEHNQDEFKHDTGYSAYVIGSHSARKLAVFRLFLDCWVPLGYGAGALVVFAFIRLV